MNLYEMNNDYICGRILEKCTCIPSFATFNSNSVNKVIETK